MVKITCWSLKLSIRTGNKEDLNDFGVHDMAFTRIFPHFIIFTTTIAENSLKEKSTMVSLLQADRKKTVTQITITANEYISHIWTHNMYKFEGNGITFSLFIYICTLVLVNASHFTISHKKSMSGKTMTRRRILSKEKDVMRGDPRE